MTYHSPKIVTPPARLPITATDETLAAAVTDECERAILQRAIVAQERRITVDGPLPPRIEIEPATAIVSLTRWTPDDDAVVVDAASYYSVTRDPSGTIIEPVSGWPEPERSIGSFALTYMAGWEVTDTENLVPASILLMLNRAVEFRATSVGVRNIKVGSLDLSFTTSYSTDKLPREIASIGRAYAYRTGLFAGR